MGTKWNKVRQEWKQNGNKNSKVGANGTKWEQSGNKRDKNMGTKWEQNGNKVGTRTPKWGKNGNKVGTKWKQSEARMGTNWE